MAQPQITAAERIRDLSSISSTVPDLLTSAGNALSALTGAASAPVPVNGATASNGDSPMSPGSGLNDTQQQPSVASSKEAFTANATAYFTTLQAIMARLRRQVYALEEAGIITPEAPGLALANAETQQQEKQQQQQQGKNGPAAYALALKQAEEEARLLNGGLGSLDVAYLNSRVGTGAVEKEGELLREARDLLRELIARRQEEREEEGEGEGEDDKAEAMDEAP